MLATNPEQRRALFIGCTAHAIQDGLSAAIYVLLPILAQAFGLSYAQVGLLKGAKSLTQAILELSSGFLAERIGPSRSLVLGLFLAGLGYLLLLAVDQTSTLLACLVVIGIGSAFQHAPASTLVSEAFATKGQRGALGIYNSSGDVGKLAFATCFGLAIGVGVAWQQVTVAFGLIALLAALVIGLAPASPFIRRATGAYKQKKINRSASRWGILDNRSFSTLMLVIFLDNLVQAGVLVFVAFAMTSKGIPLYFSTMGAVVVLAGGIFGKAGCGFLAQWLGSHRAFILVQLITVVGLVCVILTPPWVAFGLLLPLGVFSQGSTSITYGLIPELVHSERLARGYALMYSLTSFASAIGPFLLGLLADQFKIEHAFFAMAFVTLISALLMIIVPIKEQ